MEISFLMFGNAGRVIKKYHFISFPIFGLHRNVNLQVHHTHTPKKKSIMNMKILEVDTYTSERQQEFTRMKIRAFLQNINAMAKGPTN